MWKCTECGELVEEQSCEFCWKCGAKKQSPSPTDDLLFNEARSPVQALFDIPSDPQLINCPTCKAQISSHAASCPHCGHPMKASSVSPTIATHRDFLEEVIHPYKYAGYQVVQQTEYSITMVKAQNNFSVGTAVLLWIVFWPAGLWYTLSNRSRRDKIACFRVLPDGRIEISGDVLERGESKSDRGMIWVVVSIIVVLAIIMVFILAATK